MLMQKLKDFLAPLPGAKLYLCACGNHSANNLFESPVPIEFIQAEDYCGAPD